jgi:ABC-type branched-subunit amino acid transport system permease subunit
VGCRAFLFPEQVFYVAMAALILCYLFAAWLVNTRFGRVCVAIRENEVRAELLGYDARAYKLGIFTIGAGIAAIGGVLFCNGVGRVTPDVFSLFNAALTIIWVIVGGRGTLIGPIGATFALFYLTSSLGGQGAEQQSGAGHHPDRLRAAGAQGSRPRWPTGCAPGAATAPRRARRRGAARRTAE